jgi:tryptophan-rich sensory protein
MDWIVVFSLVGFLIACFAAASTGAVFKPGDWYDRLDKPSWNPPDWLFPVAWSALFIMIGVAGWLVWRQAGFGLPLAFWVLQLLLNAVWSAVFFGLRRLGWAALEAGAMWGAILACVILFFPISPAAGWLMLPYLAWVSFAILLNTVIWRRNPGPHPVITWAELKAPSRAAAARAAARMAQRAQ